MLSAASNIAAAPAVAQRVMARGLASVARREVVIVASKRTPIGGFQGSLSSLTAPQLGAVAIKQVLKDTGIKPEDIEEAYMGNVLSAAQGQAPCRQAVLGAGLPQSVICTTVNKVCSSGMKSIMIASSSIALGDRSIMIAGGMESMSNAPYYVPKGRTGYRYGHGQLLDAVLFDGLWDPYNNFHMGNCGEKTSRDLGITREDQDNYAIRSYKAAQKGQKEGIFTAEIVPVEIKGKGGKTVVVDTDEEPNRVDMDKLKSLKPAFDKNGTITAGNASSLNDGAIAMILMSAEKAAELGLKPLARIVSYGDAEVAPVDFSIAPPLATNEALKRAGLKVSDIDWWEVNEAFSCVPIAAQKALGFDMDKCNVDGGAVSIGHPIGMSGARILGHLAHKIKDAPAGTKACAMVCNGGGGGSAVIIESM